jgi:hypothetical protein
MRWSLTSGALRSSAALVALACFFGPLSGAVYANSDDVVKVEEDWEMVVTDPDPTTNAPQVTCVTSPVGHVDGLYVAFDLNHHSLTDYYSGGLQLQLWNNDVPIANDYPSMYQMLSNDNETVTWTQRMKVNEGLLKFEVVNGVSASWGAFGGSNLAVFVPSSMSDLNQYSPDVSVANSGVGFAGNRVQSLTLKRVRLYKRNGQVEQRDVNAVVHHN